MPFQSEAQRRLLWAKRPDIARKWTKKYGSKPQPGKPTEGALKRRMEKGKANGKSANR